MANTIVLGYPQPQDGKIRVVFDHYGPLSYANIGGSSGAGDVINATDLAMGGFDVVGVGFGAYIEGYTVSGNYVVKMFSVATAGTPSDNYPPGSAFKSFILQWFTVTSTPFSAISTEVANATNLSAEYLRLDATCV